MIFHADMEYFIVPPPMLSPHYYMVIEGGSVNCSDILPMKQIPFSKVNTKWGLGNSDRHFTDQVSQESHKTAQLLVLYNRNGKNSCQSAHLATALCQ